MKFHIIAALVGLSQSVKISENMKHKLSMSDSMKDICKGVTNIQKPNEAALLQLNSEPAGEGTDEAKTKESVSGDKTTKAISGTATEHYGKTKEQIDAENKAILDTQKKCLDFVAKHQEHPEICEWCQNEYKRPDNVWKWNPEEETWYKWYDGGWHYWGPSKDGFTGTGWTWYNGYWHHGGFVYKYEDGHWWRFVDGEWTKYGEEVPVDPKQPTGGKICRPFYKMMKEGFPESLASDQIPRCKVGDSIYMWTDEAACQFLGGVKSYEERVKCKSGEEHKWKRVVKCVQGQEVLESGGFDYNTGKLKTSLYNFKECQLYAKSGSSSMYLVLFGKKHSISHTPASKLFLSGVKVTTVSTTQFDSIATGTSISSSAKLVEAEGGSHFLYNYSMMQIESQAAFDNCHFDINKLQKMSEADFAKNTIGDIIVAP